jgi:hypothetical protein
MSKARRVAVVEKEQTTTRACPAARDEGLFAIAMLRVAMELKRPDSPGLSEILDGVAARMGIPRGDIEAYIGEKVGVLQDEA